ncbi:MAG: ABC transporter permease subunit [Verrucomicrobiota bacterium]
MTFLPIVERELRVASRRKSTYLTRPLAVLVGLIVTGIFLSMESRMGSMFNLGWYLFMALAWLSFIFVCFAGMILTSDAISQERREGTLGLLFLTDLRGYDIILGKLMANSVQSFYGLLAMFPVLALPLLMGGVTGAEFWRMMLVLINGLFFSLALGIFVSSVSRDSQKALHATFFLSAIFIMGAPFLDPFFTWKSTTLFLFSCASPGTVFLQTIKKNYQMFWLALAISNGVGWIFLALASYLTPRLWQEKVSETRNESRWQRWRFGSPEARPKLRAQLVDKNPVYWLISRQDGHGFISRLILYGFPVIIFLEFVRRPGANSFFVLSHWFLFFVILGFDIWMASQASRFFVESCRTGSLELLLCSPLTLRQIVEGQWWALRRMFLFPAFLVLIMHLLCGIIEWGFYANMNLGAGFNSTYHVVRLLCGMVGFIAGLITLGWVGMWMGLTTKRTNIAVLKTFVFVVIIPSFVLTVLQIFVSFRIARLGSFSLVFSTIFTALLSLGVNIAFIVWARRKLYSELRDIAASGGYVFKVAQPHFAFFKEAKNTPVIANPAPQ